MTTDLEHHLRARFTRQFFLLEAVLYIGVALLLAALALAGVAGALWDFIQTLASGAFLAGGADRGGRAVCTVGKVGAKRPRNSAGRSAPGQQCGAGPAMRRPGWGHWGPQPGRPAALRSPSRAAHKRDARRRRAGARANHCD